MALLFTDPAELNGEVYLETREELLLAKYTGIDGTGEWEFDVNGEEKTFPVDEYLGTWRCWKGKPSIGERNCIKFNPVFGLD